MEKNIINNIRVTSASMIERAKSGHPGIALSMAPLLYTLYANNLKVVPKDSKHILRDRFVLSAGHASSAYYCVLSAMGYKVGVEDLKKFRRLGSVTPGHPEYNVTDGVDCSTGPLGQGVATAVGMAIAERMMVERFNKPDLKLIDNYTYVLAGDGCLMEGVANEALSLAGTLKLNKLIVFYDSNKISIEGNTDETFAQNTEQVMLGYGFNVLHVQNPNDIKEINSAIKMAKKSASKPTMVILHSTIGWGSHMQGLAKVHGTPLGENGVEQLKKNLGFKGNAFEYSAEDKKYLAKVTERFALVEKEFNLRIKEYKQKYKADYAKFTEFLKCDFSKVEDAIKNLVVAGDKSLRELGGVILNAIAEGYNSVVGGAADVAPSTKTEIKSSGYISAGSFKERNIHYGVREFGMACISNGLALYGGFRPFASTFFVFSDYMKNGIRHSALMNLPVVYVLTHDSIAVGEDGPTHHAVEQLWTLRNTPNVDVYRPCDFNEAKACYVSAYKNLRPSVVVLCRQQVKKLNSSYSDALKGGYVLKEPKGKLDGIIIATGSEVELAMQTAEILENKGVFVRVVSMPSTNVFDRQTEAYKQKVLPKNITNRMSIELGCDGGWYKYLGLNGKAYCINTFGASGDFNELLKHFKFEPQIIAKEFMNLIKNNKK